MKPRIKIDGLFMSSIIILTAVIYLFPQLYPQNQMLDDVLDFIGVLALFKGLFLRTVARGFKKQFSNQSHGLVTSGPYSLTRNPMYLGTYLIGVGFILMLWPWWGVLFFSAAFYMRFRIQIRTEEEFLQQTFGEEYTKYCQAVPRIFPRFDALSKIKIKEAFPLNLAWTTKERRAIAPVLIAALLMETLKEWLVFGTFTPGITLLIIFAGAGVFSLGLWIRYQES